VLSAGTAMFCPTLRAAVGDVAHPAWRARAVGTCRLWRDSGFAIGALLAGVFADALGLRAAIGTVAALTAASGLLVLVRMYDALPAADWRSKLKEMQKSRLRIPCPSHADPEGWWPRRPDAQRRDSAHSTRWHLVQHDGLGELPSDLWVDTPPILGFGLYPRWAP